LRSRDTSRKAATAVSITPRIRLLTMTPSSESGGLSTTAPVSASLVASSVTMNKRPSPI